MEWYNGGYDNNTVQSISFIWDGSDTEEYNRNTASSPLANFCCVRDSIPVLII